MNKSKRYDAIFFNEPPDLPDFFYKQPHRGQKSYARLIKWAQREYNDALRLWAKQKKWDQVRYYASEVSPMRVLAMLPDFQRLMAYMTGETWKLMNREEKRFLQASYEIYMAFSGA